VEYNNLFRTKRREYLVVLLFFLVMAILFTWPLILHIHNGVIGGYGDPMLNNWIISWEAKTIFANPTNIFQGNILYPARDVLAYSEHLFTLGLLGAPIYHLSGNPVLTYNLLIFFAIVFSAFGCYLLIKELTGSRWGGLFGGLFFALCPYRIAKADHIQILFSAFLPFMLLYLFRYLEKGRIKYLVLFGLFFLLQSLTSWHYLVFCTFAAVLLLLWTAFFSRKKEEWLRLGAALVIILVAMMIILPFALPYIRAHSRLPGFERTLEEAEFYGASARDYLRVLPESVVYGGAASPAEEGGVWLEKVLFPGFLILLLALAGLFIRRREEDNVLAFEPEAFKRGALYFLVLAVLSFVLTLGPEIFGVTNPFYTFLYNLGILRFIRFPSRFYVLVALGLSVLAGYGVAKIAARMAGWRKNWRAGRITALVLVLLLAVEIATFNVAIYPVPVWGEVPEVYSWLKEQVNVRVIELPTSPLGEGALRYDAWEMGLVSKNKEEYNSREGMRMYFSTYHWKDIANGYSGYFPFFNRRIITEMQAFPSQRSANLLRTIGIDCVLWHWDWVEEDERAEIEERLASIPQLSLEKEFEDTAVYRLEQEDLADIDELEVSPETPEAVPEGEGFNLALLVKNTSSSPFAAIEEDPQPLYLRFLDDKGEVVYEERTEYRPLFFLDGGEETFLPAGAAGTPGVGDYLLELRMQDSVLGEITFSMDIAVREPEALAGTGNLSGVMTLRGGEESIAIPVADGLYPLVLTVKNDGDTLWRSKWEEEQLGGIYPFGLAFLGVVWSQDGNAVWEEQAAVLPCDVSPGQSIQVPALLRPPSQPGTYELYIGLRDKDIGWFGVPLIVEVLVSLDHPQ